MTVVLQTTVSRYLGLSSDTKPTTEVPAGSTFFETDTRLVYVYNGSAWSVVSPSAQKTLTFTGAANLGAVGAVPLFTVTGEVLIEYLVPFCTVNLTEAAPGGATIALGTAAAGGSALFIAASTVLDIDAGTFWIDATPGDLGAALPAALKDVVVTDSIRATVAVAAVNGGAIRFDAYWRPLGGGSLVAA